MLFNSFGFAFFLLIIFIFYWFIVNRKVSGQNLLLLFGSYFFFSCWDWRFLFLLASSTFLGYFTGLQIYNSHLQRYKRTWLTISIIINIGILGYFKYSNFFIESFIELFRQSGFETHYSSLSIILPVGISFYTFHGLSYVLDIYNNRIKPTKSLINYSLFVSFFPLLVAGPIERATNLLPQLKSTRKFDYTKSVNGLRQILWGLFKKVVIADGCAIYADQIFNNTNLYSGSTLVLGAIFFTFQIYGDFSGYSDIALGTARLFGFELLQNFKYPYFSRSVAEFWRRWHISLSSWFKDYLYVPLGGSEGHRWKTMRNVLIVFIVSGFWHGANWTFIVWGFLNALYMMPSIIFKTTKSNLNIVAAGRNLPTAKEFVSVLFTFILIAFGWIFFRAENLTHSYIYISKLFSTSLFYLPNNNHTYSKYIILVTALFMIVEWIGRENKYAIEKIEAIISLRSFRWLIYSIITIMILFSHNTRINQNNDFIYFQF